MRKILTLCLVGLATSVLAGPGFAESAELVDSIWTFDDGQQLVEAVLLAGGKAEITIDEDPENTEMLACNGLWQVDGNKLDVSCGDSGPWHGMMQDDGSGVPVWSRLPEGTETGPLRAAFIESVLAEMARIEGQSDAAAHEQEASVPVAMGQEQRSSISGGSYSWSDSGQLQFDIEFEGDMIAFDFVNGTGMKVTSGMSKAGFKALAEKEGVSLRTLSEDEYQVGQDIFVFEKGVLTRTRTGN